MSYFIPEGRPLCKPRKVKEAVALSPVPLLAIEASGAAATVFWTCLDDLLGLRGEWVSNAPDNQGAGGGER